VTASDEGGGARVEKLAVMLVHGILNNDEEHFADTGVRLLRSAFAAEAGITAEEAAEALVIRMARWGEVSQPYEDRLLARLGTDRGSWFYNWLDREAAKVDAGSVTALAGAALSGLARTLPGGPPLHYPTLRWLLTQYLGDAIAYQITPSDRTLYDDVHAVLAGTLHELAGAAGPDAPLCVVAHSLGTIISSDYFYDLQLDGGVYPRPAAAPSPVPAPVRREMGDTPLERGETLTFLHTMGSPLALWTLRLADHELDRPVRVPDPRSPAYRSGIGGWVNIYDPDDVVASPLGCLGDHYARRVHDRRCSVGPPLLGATPLAHLGYWNDRGVMGGIGRALAQAWAD
jgi:hypothetical protein